MKTYKRLFSYVSKYTSERNIFLEDNMLDAYVMRNMPSMNLALFNIIRQSLCLRSFSKFIILSTEPGCPERNKKVTAILVTGHGSPLSCETSRLPHFLDNHGWRWGCQPYAPAALDPPEIFVVLISVRGIVRLEGLSQLKNPMTSSGIEPATLGFVP
jgi:hypothetical protein